MSETGPEHDAMGLLAEALVAFFVLGDADTGKEKLAAAASAANDNNADVASAEDPEPEASVAEADIAFTLAAACQQADRPCEALDFYARAGRMYRTLGDPRAEAYVLLKTATVHHDFGNLVQMTDACERALVIARRAGVREAEAAALVMLAKAYRAQGKFTEAKRCYSQSRSIAREIGLLGKADDGS